MAISIDPGANGIFDTDITAVNSTHRLGPTLVMIHGL